MQVEKEKRKLSSRRLLPTFKSTICRDVLFHALQMFQRPYDWDAACCRWNRRRASRTVGALSETPQRLQHRSSSTQVLLLQPRMRLTLERKSRLQLTYQMHAAALATARSASQNLPIHSGRRTSCSLSADSSGGCASSAACKDQDAEYLYIWWLATESVDEHASAVQGVCSHVLWRKKAASVSSCTCKSDGQC